MSPVKIGIGTVQFGMDYGISGRKIKTEPNEVENILAFAIEKDLSILDTAPAYGESERVLGKVLPSHHSFKIVTKTPIYRKEKINASDTESLKSSVLRSLENLRLEKLYALLIHDSNDLLAQDGHLLGEALQQLRHDGLVEKIGVSVYNAKQIDLLLEIFIPDVIQLPINLLDQRLIASGHLRHLKKLNVEIHARSLFLQGLLLMNPTEIPPYFDRVRGHLTGYQQFLEDQKLNSMEASIGFAKQVEELDVLICGARTCEELRQIYSAWDRPKTSADFARFALQDEEILNPSLWKTK